MLRDKEMVMLREEILVRFILFKLEYYLVFRL
jgi:hypothetical protein